jgi:hypothetical protein
MCFAGMEDDIKSLVKQVAAKAEVNVLDARIDHGHLNMLVEHRGWVRSADLLEHHVDLVVDEDLSDQPVNVRHISPQVPAFLAASR